MKTDRLLAEVLYLLQNGRVTAQQLAGRFEVSPRTILRDMESLCMAGVPVISFAGTNGGFALDESYRIDHRAASPEDIRLIVTALTALSTAVQDQRLTNAVEKFRPLQKDAEEMTIDLAALNEDARIQENLAALRGAIRRRRAVVLRYTNSAGQCAEHTVEPLQLAYKWYAWYLYAWSRVKQQVLTYKLVRMDRVTETDEVCPPRPDALPGEDARPTVTIEALCKESARVPLIEYLHARPIETLPTGEHRLRMTLPTEEFFWRGALLSLGSAVRILSPQWVIDELRERAQDILSAYPDKP